VDLIRIRFMVSMAMTRDMRSGCSVSTIGTSQFSPSQPSLTVKELVEQQVCALTVEMKAKYEAQEKKLEEIMTRYEAYFSSHYPFPYESPRDSLPLHLNLELVIDLHIYLQLIFTLYKFCNSI